jgi:hypothetical protein
MGIPGKIFTFFTSVLLLMATTSMVFGAHFCAGELAGIYLFETSETSCGNCDQIPGDSGHCSDPDDAEICHESCCQDMTLSEKAVDEMQQSATKELTSLFPVDLPLYLQQLKSENAHNDSYKTSVNTITTLDVRPADRDIPVLVQSFLL